MDCPQTDSFAQPGFFERLKTSRKRIPLAGSLEVTFRCNLRCVHCYIGENRSGVPGQQEMSTKEIFHLFDQLADAGTLWFLLTGGEPFMRRDFMDIYRYAAHKGLILTIYTNGTLLTPRIVDELADLPPFQIEITLYGATEATYEGITGVPGSYTRCMQGIERLMQRGLPLKLKTMVMRRNMHEFEAIKAFADSLGVGFRYDPLLVGALNGPQNPFSQRLSPEQVVGLEKNNTLLQSELKALLENQSGKTINSSTLYICGAALNTFHIDPYGQLCPCILSRTQSYDLLRGSFAEGWDTFLPQVRTQSTDRREYCQDCNLLVLCGQCPGKSSLENGSLDVPVDYFCQVGRLRAAAFRAYNEF
jgi:radical SAM protein with 4Fe4S-binding SPASM domain